MNKKLVKELKYEMENLRNSTISIEQHNRAIIKLERDKKNLVQALSISNSALKKACAMLRENCRNNGSCAEYNCTSCLPETFRKEVEK